MENISEAIHYHFGSLAYRQGKLLIDEVCNNPDMQDILFTKPWKLLNIYSGRKEMLADNNLKIIQNYVLSHLNPVMCNIRCLEILDANNQDLLSKLIEPYYDAFNLTPTKRTKKIFDGTKI
jgi:hypothetical protein